jgi:hypothetical protein
MLELHAFSERSDRGVFVGGQPEEGNDELILLGLKSARPALLFAEAKEAPDLIPKF